MNAKLAELLERIDKSYEGEDVFLLRNEYDLMRGALRDGDTDKERLDFSESKAATIYCSESGHWVFVNERTKTRTGCIGKDIRHCIDAAMNKAKK